VVNWTAFVGRPSAFDGILDLGTSMGCPTAEARMTEAGWCPGIDRADAGDMATIQNNRPAGDRDQPGDVHEPAEAAGGTGNDRDVLPAEADVDRPRPSNLQKDPDDWTTGDEPMTGPQKSYLHTLAQQAGEEAPADDLSKADASKAIDALQEKTGRGQ
jgi:hypothetical protein